jgi:hypothetical protein
MYAEGGVEVMARVATPPLARPGLARATRWRGALLAPLRLVLWLRVSSGKIGTLQYFPGFFLKVGFLHKNKTPGQFC